MPRKNAPHSSRRPRKGPPRYVNADGHDRTLADLAPDPGWKPLKPRAATPTPSLKTARATAPREPANRQPLDRHGLAALLGNLAPTAAHLEYAETADARLLRLLAAYPQSARGHLRSHLAGANRRADRLPFGLGEAARINRALIQHRAPQVRD